MKRATRTDRRGCWLNQDRKDWRSNCAVIPLLVIKPWRVGREGIRRRLIAELTAVRTEGIVDSVRRKWTPRPVQIGRRVLLIRIRAQFPEVLRIDGNR